MASIHSPEPVSASSWYYQLKTSLHYDELQLQNVLAIKLKEILPAYDLIYYNKSIKSLLSPYDICKPDFLLWKRDYSEWYVVEVELVNHHISHIKKQIETFYNGDYGDVSAITDYVSSKSSGLDKALFANLIASKRPKIMLMSDNIKYEWIDVFAQYECLFSSLQVYTDNNDGILYRLNGDLPQVYTSFTYCTLHKLLGAINVSFSGYMKNLGYASGEIVQIFYRGTAHFWELDISNSVETLIYDGDYIPLDLTHSRWKLMLNDKKQLHIIKS